jgi:predicted peptidase
MRAVFLLAAVTFALLAARPALAEEPKMDANSDAKVKDADFRSHQYKDTDGKTLPYRLLVPEGYEASTGPHPLLVFLHGAGERGADNRAQLTHGKEMMRAAAKDFGCFVLVPQCPTDLIWAGRHWTDPNRDLSEKPSVPMDMVLRVVDQLKKDYRIDPKRLYIMGLSMGGFGTWDTIQRHPEMFAAAVPICGGGDNKRVAEIAKLPIWVFHGDADTVVPVRLSREMVEALKAAGGSPRYTEYPGVGHDSWVRAFKEPELLKWLTAQKR